MSDEGAPGSPRFLDFHEETRLRARLDHVRESRHGLLRTWLHRRLRLAFSDFDVNAWLSMYPMSYLETEEWRRVAPELGGALLDVGAGSGDLTRALSPLCSRVVCTETSKGMARKLRRMGFETHRLDLAEEALPTRASFDALALLHVLDRCRSPHTLFDRALATLRPGGVVMVAVPLPYAPLFYEGSRSDTPRDPLLPPGLTNEEARRTLEDELFGARGLTLRTVARVPYLCPGDVEAPHYLLDSFLFVATKG